MGRGRGSTTGGRTRRQVYRGRPNACSLDRAHALVRAARRGVSIYVIMETPDKVKGEDEYSTLKALGQDVAACSGSPHETERIVR